jgi:hypothetical protein
MAGRAKPVGQADGIAKLQDLIVAKLDDPVARGAMQMIVGGITIVVLECAAIGQPELAEQSGLDEQSQGSVHGRATDPFTGIVQVADQLVGIEMLVGVEDVIDEDPSSFGQLLTPDLQELAEFLDRRTGNGQGCQLIALGFRHDRSPWSRPPAGCLGIGWGSRIDNDSSF